MIRVVKFDWLSTAGFYNNQRSRVSVGRYLHHEQFVRIGEVSGRGAVLQHVLAQVYVRAVHESLLGVLQQRLSRTAQSAQRLTWTMLRIFI